jgi:DHA1 family inner membrane transport protein
MAYPPYDDQVITKTAKYHYPLALWALTASSFAIGTTEFVVVGIMPTVAHDFRVSISSAGLQVSLYALGVAIGGPVLTTLTRNVCRKTLLVSLMALFVIAHIGSAIAPDFNFLLITRFISGFSHGVFFGVGATIAASLVAPDKKASAIAIMFAGLTLAIVTGVPLGTFIGQHFGWRSTFLGVAALGLLGLIANAVMLPSPISGSAVLPVKEQFKVLGNRPILLTLLITTLGYGGTFVAFTYLATLLENITQFSADAVSLLLLAYGVAIAAGNIIGGKLSNKNPSKTLIWIFCLQAASLSVFTFTVHFKVLAIINLFFMGGLSFAAVPGLQLYIVQLAAKYLPGTEEVTSSLNIAAFNLGVAVGATVGGFVVNSYLGLGATPWVGALFVIAAIILMIISHKKEGVKSTAD